MLFDIETFSTDEHIYLVVLLDLQFQINSSLIKIIKKVLTSR